MLFYRVYRMSVANNRVLYKDRHVCGINDNRLPDLQKYYPKLIILEKHGKTL